MDIETFINQVFGLATPEITWWQMVLRALVVYVVLVAMVRAGNKRFMAKGTAFDLVLAILLGSVASRAITGEALFFKSMAAALALVAFHWVFAALAFRLDRFAGWLKGQSRLLVQDGELLWSAMCHSHVTEKDLLEALRVQAQSKDMTGVKEAWLERNGEISFIFR